MFLGVLGHATAYINMHMLHKHLAKLYAGMDVDVDADAVVVPRKFMRKLLTFSKINATSEILHMHANTRQAA